MGGRPAGDGGTQRRQRMQTPPQVRSTGITLLGAAALPDRSTATIVTLFVPGISVYATVTVPPGTTSMIVPLTRTSYSIAAAGSTSSVEPVQRSHSSSGQAPLPPLAALSS